MPYQRIVVAAIATLIATVPNGDFRLIQNPLSQIPSSRAQAQTLSSPSTLNSPTTEQIKQVAREHNATLVEYSINYDGSKIKGKQQESELLIFVIQPTGEIGLRRVDLKSLWQQQKTSLEDLVISSRKSIGRDSRQKKSLQQLYQVLIAPIADLLPKDVGARVIFIPQQSLFFVSFPALQDKSGKYAIEQYAISTAPSIQVLDLLYQQKQRELKVGAGEPRPYKDVLVVGNPTTQQLSPLPGAEQEAKGIAQLLNTQAVIGNSATKAAVLQRMPQAGTIHLATHALLDDTGGVGSAIVLAPEGKDNGLLTADEIMKLKLNADIVVLSGANTARGYLKP